MRILEILTEIFLPFIIRIMVHKKESLTQKERKAQDIFLKNLKIPLKETEEPIVIAFIGLVGSGKSFVAREFTKLLPATIIEADKIRVQLRKQKEHYKGARKIAENVVLKVIEQGGNVVLDSDYIDSKKRASLKEKLKGKAKLIFIRIHADYDVMVSRTIMRQYPAKKDDFFGGAGSKSKCKNSKIAGSVVKLREMWRRTPHHYQWKNQGGGKWILKKLPFDVFATIDTSDDKQWKTEVKRISKLLIS